MGSRLATSNEGTRFLSRGIRQGTTDGVRKMLRFSFSLSVAPQREVGNLEPDEEEEESEGIPANLHMSVAR